MRRLNHLYKLIPTSKVDRHAFLWWNNSNCDLGIPLPHTGCYDAVKLSASIKVSFRILRLCVVKINAPFFSRPKHSFDHITVHLSPSDGFLFRIACFICPFWRDFAAVTFSKRILHGFEIKFIFPYEL